MKYNFDKIIERQGTNSIKWEFILEDQRLVQRKYSQKYKPAKPLLPMWVADMDFAAPKPVIEALTERARHGIFGYAAPTDEYYKSVINWMKSRYKWEISPDWICITPGVVPALYMLVRFFVPLGDKVLIQPPVYNPFFTAITNNGAEVVTNQLIYENGHYRMDFDDLRAKARDPRVWMAILCSPHNPVGRVWSEEELTTFAEICLESEVLVISDEIHADLILNANKFTPFARISEAFAHNAVICTSPSKSFNLAGLKTSNIIIPNDIIRAKFTQAVENSGMFGANCFGLVATQAAYNEGEEWLQQVIEYIENNLKYLNRYIASNLPEIKVIQPEGTYLVWLDCHELGLAGEELEDFIIEEAGVYVEGGYQFGPGGSEFIRINIACPKSILEEGLSRIRKALKSKKII